MTGNTQLLGLALPVDGGLDGEWGDVVNDSITSLVDSAVAGTTTLSADSDVILTTTVLAANQARQAIIRWTASNGATTRNITAPAQSKPYIVINAGTGSIVLRGNGSPPTTGITIVAGERCVAAWSGSDFVKVATSATTTGTVTSVGGTGTVNGITLTGTVTSSGNLTLGGALSGVSLATQVTGTLPIANGGTGATSLTANNVILGNGTSAVQVVAPGTNGNVLTSDGTTWTSATPTTPPAQVYPGAGVAVSTGTAWATSLTAPSGAIVGTTDTQTLTNKTIQGGVLTRATAIVLAADQLTADFTGIPSWVKRITLMISQLGTVGSNPTILLGDSGGFETSGYTGAATRLDGVDSNRAVALSSSFLVEFNNTGIRLSGNAVLTNITGNTWIFSLTGGNGGAGSNPGVFVVAGSKTLSDTLTQIRFATTGSAFSSGGIINIMYEG